MRDVFDIHEVYAKTDVFKRYFHTSVALEKFIPGVIINLERGRLTVCQNDSEDNTPYVKELASSNTSTLLSGSWKKNIGTVMKVSDDDDDDGTKKALVFDSDESLWVQQPMSIWEALQFLEEIKDNVSKEDYRLGKKMLQDFLDILYPGVIRQGIEIAKKKALEKAASLKSDKKRAERFKEIKQQNVPMWNKTLDFTTPVPIKKIRSEIAQYEHPVQTVAFEYNGKSVYEYPIIQYIVEEQYRKKLKSYDARIDECPICGKKKPLVTNSNGFINRELIGGMTNGCGFSTFNNPQFLSYGLSKEESSCMCAECGRKITDGWNILLGVQKIWIPGPKENSKKGGRYEFIENAFRVNGYNKDYAIVAFATDAQGKPYQIAECLNEINDYEAMEAINPENTQITKVFKTINSNSKVSQDDFQATVYIVAPNMARLAIHRRFNLNFKELLNNINTWKEASKCVDIEYVDDHPRKYMYYPKVTTILRVLGAYGEKGAFYSSISDTVWSMILGGLRTERNFLNQTINEIHSDFRKSGNKFRISRNNFATLRFAYNAGKNKEDWMKAELNEKYTDPCYQFGRLLAVAESLVYFANDRKNDMISGLYDRCVENPVGALNDLESNIRYYYQKGIKENRAAAVQARYNQFSEIMAGIALDLHRMSQEDCAQFIAGFHQQRIAERTKKSEPLVSDEE